MSRLTLFHMAILAFASLASASELPMGAAAFGWPPSRLWDQASESSGPCGSHEGPGERTNFTYYKGHVVLLTQAPVWNLRLGISAISHPESTHDFKPLIQHAYIAELDAGITCLHVPDAPVYIKAGHPATLQLKYEIRDGSPSGSNQTLFACADITYVAPSDLAYRAPCFNTTVPKDRTTGPTTTLSATPKPWRTLNPSDSDETKEFTPGEDKRVDSRICYVAAFGGSLVVTGIAVAVYKFVLKPRKEARRSAALRREAAEAERGARRER
ncbi:hypothetical protein V8C42DRAFT_357877 [Trichoderma barbatum]